MRSENINEIKKDDRSAFKRFIFLIIIGMLVGFMAGMLSGYLEEGLAELLAVGIQNMLAYVAPFMNVILIPVVFLPILYLYHVSRKRYQVWDGENEALLEKIEINLSYALWFSSVAVILSFFFFAVGLWQITNLNYSVSGAFLAAWLGSFILVIIGTTLAQQKIVNFTKEINPEKEGSVFDHNFSKRWEESCDEAEKLMIYKSAYKSYKTVSTTCIILWIVCLLGSSIWDFGLLPVTFVSIIWMVQTTSYCFESIRLEKVRKNK